MFGHPVIGAIATTWIIGAATTVGAVDVVHLLQDGVLPTSGWLIALGTLLVGVSKAAANLMTGYGDLIKKQADAKLISDGADSEAYQKLRQQHGELLHEYIKIKCHNEECTERWMVKRDKKPGHEE